MKLPKWLRLLIAAVAFVAVIYVLVEFGSFYVRTAP